jgi:hypothetical protein
MTKPSVTSDPSVDSRRVSTPGIARYAGFRRAVTSTVVLFCAVTPQNEEVETNRSVKVGTI